MDHLVVELNKNGVNTIEPATTQFETTGEFEVQFHTHDRPGRVYVRAEGPLGDHVSVAGQNYLVTPNEPTTVLVDIPRQARPVAGTLFIETGYGAESASIDIEIDQSPPEPSPTTTDSTTPTATTDQSVTPSPSPVPTAINRQWIPVIGVALVTIIAAAIVLAVVGPQPGLLAAGFVAVLTAVGGVGYLVTRT